MLNQFSLKITKTLLITCILPVLIKVLLKFSQFATTRFLLYRFFKLLKGLSIIIYTLLKFEFVISLY